MENGKRNRLGKETDDATKLPLRVKISDLKEREEESSGQVDR